MRSRPLRRLRGFLHPAWGPILRVQVWGPRGESAKGLAVLDTGASLSAIDRQLALALDLPSEGAARWLAISDTGSESVAPVRTAVVGLGDDTRLWELQLLEIPKLGHAVEGSRVVLLLGWNFLDQCTLVTDGPAGMFSLTLPGQVGAAHRRR